MTPTKSQQVDILAINAARVLSKFGAEHPDYSEWRYLRDSLLRIMPELGKEAAGVVGKACAAFNESQ